MFNLSFVFETTFTHIENMMFFIGKQIIQKKARSKKTIDNILSNARENLDETQQKIFTYKNFDFIDDKNFLIVNEKGVIVKPQEITEEKRSWIKTAKETPWKGHVATRDIGMNTQKPIVPFGFGITDVDNNHIGILGIGVSIDNLKKTIEDSLLMKSHYKFTVYNSNDMSFVMESSDNEQEEKYSSINPQELKELLINIKNKESLSGTLSETININGVDYIFYNKTINFPFIILIGIKRRKIFNTEDLERQILKMNEQKRYSEMFLTSLLYLFQTKMINSITDERVQIQTNFKIPKVFSENVNNLILELEQLESFYELKIERDILEEGKV